MAYYDSVYADSELSHRAKAVYIYFIGDSKRRGALESQGTSQFPRLWAETGVPLFCNLGWVLIYTQGFQQVRLMLQI